MSPSNYRQAKRQREDARKKRQQQKLERKMSRGVPAAASTEPAERAPESDAKELP